MLIAAENIEKQNCKFTCPITYLRKKISFTRLNMLACRPAILSRASAKRLPYNLGVFITETVLDKLGADATETVLNFNIL